ncbi:MAG: oligosaccharide flippase family protein [Spirochaetota bacterium]|nr:oligosaccharide flippase family protein [Spirochaetota bacterium]
MSSVAVIQLCNNVYLGRELTKEEFGLYSFVFLNVAHLLAIFLIFGQGASVVRYFSSKTIEDYQWKKYLFKFLLLIIFPLIITSFTVKIIYHLDWFWFYMIAGGSFLLCNTNLTGAFFRARGWFNQAIIIERANPIVFFILLLFFFLFGKMNLDIASYLKLFSFLSVMPFIFYILANWNEGQIQVETKIYSDGISLWELSLTVIVLYHIDAFFIAKLLGYKELALFSVMIAIMRIYEFASVSLFSVYSQKFSKNRDINIKLFFKFLLIIVLFIGIFYLLFTNIILEILFKGKYYASFILIVLFTIYGSINLLYVLPSCYLVGHSDKKEMRQMLLGNIISIVIRIIIIYVLYDYGLFGFLLAGIISMGTRTGVGYYIIFNNRSNA